jgi:chromosome segregation ATPase
MSDICDVNRLNKRNAQVAELRRQLANEKAAFVSMAEHHEAETATLKAELEQAQAIIRERDAEIEQLREGGRAMSEACKGCTEWALMYDRERTKCADLRRQLEVTRRDLADSTAQLELDNEECVALRRQLAEARKDLADCVEQAKASQLRIAAECIASQKRIAHLDAAGVQQIQVGDAQATIAQQGETIATLREAMREGIDWLSSRTDRTEGDVATACRMQDALDAGKETDISRDMAMLAAFESGYQTAQAEYEETGRVAGMKQPVAGVE